MLRISLRDDASPRPASAFAQPHLRFFISMAPLIGVLVVAEYLALTGSGSFSSLLGILGAIALPLLAGIFPVLLLASTRRKGDFVPADVPRVLGNPILLTLVYLFFVGILFAYGLFIFQETLTRALMLLVAGVTVAVTALILRRGALDIDLRLMESSIYAVSPRLFEPLNPLKRNGIKLVEFRLQPNGVK